MAITATQVGTLPYYTEGHRKVTFTDVTLGTADYPTGGVAVTADQLRLATIKHAEAQITVSSNADDALSTATFTVDTGGNGGKIVLYDKSPAELTANDDVSACVVRVTASGY